MRTAVAAILFAVAWAAAAEPFVYPEAHWEKVADPETAGWSKAGLEAFRVELARTNTAGLVVVNAGRVIFEYGDVSAPRVVASVRKSLLSVLYGNYVAAGKINLDATLAALGIDDIGGLSDKEKQATVRDLLEARSGVYHAASNSGDDSAHAPPRDSQAHGTYFLYNNWDFNALGTIFEKQTGRNIYDAFESDLARPLGMEDFDRGAQRKSGNLSKSMHPAYHIRISPRDLARIGYLMLREGNWAGQQIVPRAWVKESARVITPAAQMNSAAARRGPLGYGYLWWVWDARWATGPFAGAFTAHGLGGQHLSVLPALDIVVAHQTPGSETGTHPAFWRLLETLARAKCRNTPC